MKSRLEGQRGRKRAPGVCVCVGGWGLGVLGCRGQKSEWAGLRLGSTHCSEGSANEVEVKAPETYRS